MRSSDEKTKHRSALTISIVASVIILSVVFLFIKDSFFQLSPKDSLVETENTANDKNSVVSPISSFSKFLQDSGKRFGDLKSAFGEMSSAVKQVNDIANIAEENASDAPILESNPTTTKETSTSTSN